MRPKRPWPRKTGELGRARRQEKVFLKQEGQQKQRVEISVGEAARRLGWHTGKSVDLGGWGWKTMEEPGDKAFPEPRLRL